MKNIQTRKGEIVQDPPFVTKLFNTTIAVYAFLALRVWLGYKWIDAALHKIDNPAWTQTGEAIKGFWMNSVAIPEQGRPAISFDWYRNFIQGLIDSEAHAWFGPMVAYGELLIGIALVLGAFTGIAAFFGAFMNWNFMMAGSASSNPMLFVVALLLIMGWKVAGYIGADYYLLKLLGTPWKNGEKYPEGKVAPTTV